MKRYIVIAYDIEKDRKRREVAKLLEAWGKRVNKSVFECFISDVELKRLKAKLEKMVKKGSDSILCYPLCANCIDNIERFGTKAPEREIVKIF